MSPMNDKTSVQFGAPHPGLLKVLLAVALAAPVTGIAAMPNFVHRGWGIEWPENSIVALRRCWEAGQIPEADARITSDGVIFAIHDPPRGMSYSDFDKKPWSFYKALDAGDGKGARWKGTPLPTWDEIFAEMAGHPERRILLDIKTQTPQQMYELARKHGVERQVICLANGTSVTKAWRKLVPGAKGMVGLHPKYWAHAFLEGEQAAESNARVAATFDKLEADGFDGADIVSFTIRVDLAREEPFCPPTAFLRDRVARLHAAKRIAVAWIWTQDDREESYHRLRKLGFDCFGTDHPEVMLRALGRPVP